MSQSGNTKPKAQSAMSIAHNDSRPTSPDDEEFSRTDPNEMSLASIAQEFAPSAYKLCRGYLGGAWKTVTFQQFMLEPVSGGLSNYLYLCKLPESIELHSDEPRQVLVRLYGQVMDFSARVYEGVIFSLLSERRFGPHLYGVFPSGRIEQYIPSRHLTVEELFDKKFSKAIAEQAAKYHSMQLPLNMEPVFIWKKMEQMLKTSRTIKWESPAQLAAIKEIESFGLEKEYRLLRDYLQSEESNVVFCHNDLQEGNILLLKSNGEVNVQVIDYEYSSYNYREFDFGNHFCESMYRYNTGGPTGFERTTQGYPSYEKRFYFVQTYLNSMAALSDNASVDTSSSAVDHLVKQSDKFSLASHFFWAIWSLVQCISTCIEFGYLEYGIVRLQDYKSMKQTLGVKF